MIVMQVFLKVKAEHLDAFIAAALDNARATTHEPGNLRFDVLQQSDDPTRFTVVEIYASPEAQQAHRESAHFAAWRAATADLIEERTFVYYTPLSPTTFTKG